MWRAEGDPRTRSTGILLETLATEPSWQDFHATVERLVAAVPRLRDRVVEPSLPVVQPVWSPDPDFDLSRHVRRERVVAQDDRALMRLCEELFDHPSTAPAHRGRRCSSPACPTAARRPAACPPQHVRRHGAHPADGDRPR